MLTVEQTSLAADFGCRRSLPSLARKVPLALTLWELPPDVSLDGKVNREMRKMNIRAIDPRPRKDRTGRMGYVANTRRIAKGVKPRMSAETASHSIGNSWEEQEESGKGGNQVPGTVGSDNTRT